jgi:hypothetical protein
LDGPAHGEQQKEVAPVPEATPLGPPPLGVQAPAAASVMFAVGASSTGSGPVKATHALGAFSEPPMQLLMAGAPIVHSAPAGAPHVHAEHPRWSAIPA